MATYLKDIASVPASAIAEIEGDVRKQLAMGEISMGEIGEAIEDGLQGYALGFAPRMKMAPSQRPPRKFGKSSSVQPTTKHPGYHRAKHYVQAPGKAASIRMMPVLHGGTLNGLGDILDDAAKSIASGVQDGSVPQSSISKLINDAAAVITGKPVPHDVAAPAASASNIAKTAIPVGMIGLLVAAAFLMTGGGKKKYRSNPSRRRSSRRGRGGGMDVQKIVMWGGGGLAAYYFLLRPGATLLPSLTAPKPAAAGSPSATQAALAAGVKAAPGIFDSIAKLFGGGSTSTTSTATKPAATAPSQFITDYSQIGVQQSSPPAESQFVLDYGTESA